ncbi:MAG: hypothetical protein L6R42_001199 [Xanthoria sp. 1 TBL-2021]|nr:MAG: hypothetical protein L6R42_001199 [Xanthoria sp. 1 TBL-2021]
MALLTKAELSLDVALKQPNPNVVSLLWLHAALPGSDELHDPRNRSGAKCSYMKIDCL